MMRGTGPSVDVARREVQAIISSGIFAPSSRQAMLLEYLFNKVVEGRATDLKEFSVAVDLFHKPLSFDSHSDATVRVEAHRLRKKLEKYYETFGRHSELRVVLPAGQYLLQFQPPPTEERRVVTAPDTGTGSPSAPRPKRKALFWGATVAAVLLCFVGLNYVRVTRPPLKKAQAPASQTNSTVPDPEPGAVRILVGHTGDPYVDSAGRRWQSDRFFEGGVVRKVSHEVFLRTGHPRLFQLVREGTSRYRIPLPPGEYEMHVYLTYPDVPGIELGPDRRFRIMDIQVNGRVVGVYDLAAEVGLNADIRTFAHLRPNDDGILDVSFHSARGPAAVSAIEILPMIQGRVRTVRIIAQPRPFLDVKGHFWYPDDYYSGGNPGDFPAMVNGGVDPGIVSLDRTGDFEYFIPVAEGEYELTLYFGEVYHGRGQIGGGGVGSRVFDVLLNNEMLFRNFDILREAPPMQLVTRTIRPVRPDKQGKIHLTFSPKAHLASVRAIEVVPER
jgi:hypothetical protein